MEKIDIVNTVLFDSILEFKKTNGYVDIHNDYEVESVMYDPIKGNLKLLLNSLENNPLEILFENVLIIEMNIKIDDKVIDNFYRGRFESEGDVFDEIDNRKCFYIDFDGGSKINLLCEKAVVLF